MAKRGVLPAARRENTSFTITVQKPTITTNYSRTAIQPHSLLYGFILSMMEQPDSCKYHSHAISVAGIDYRIVTNGTAGLNDIFYAASARAVDVIKEGEEGIGAHSFLSSLVNTGGFTLKVFSQMPSASTSI